MRHVALPTGSLELELNEGQFGFDALLGVGVPATPGAGFLFLSKVLGKHWPAKPSVMREVHASLAAGIPALAGPVLFIAIESAIGLGQGVLEAWREAHPGQPARFLHRLPGSRERSLLMGARSLVLVGEEASSATGVLKLARACRALNPAIGEVHLAAVTNFLGGAALATLAQGFGVPFTVGAALSGAYRFTPGPLPLAMGATHACDDASGLFGRPGLPGALSAPAVLVRELASGIGAREAVLVLATGEFMQGAYVLGAALERLGIDVAIQSTTRAPILPWGAVAHALSFRDTSGGEGPNFLYNVRPGQYACVFICHETAPNDALYHLAAVLGARLFYFQGGSHVEEVSEICVQ